MNSVTEAKALPEFRLQVTFVDGYSAVVDLKQHILKSNWPIVLPLKDAPYFRRVRMANGSIVWPNGYDVCPDVLRYWCEVGHATSQEQTDAHFSAIEQKVA